jgi:tetrahydromethanopterin S-methyltransferase subunit G
MGTENEFDPCSKCSSPFQEIERRYKRENIRAIGLVVGIVFGLTVFAVVLQLLVK